MLYPVDRSIFFESAIKIVSSELGCLTNVVLIRGIWLQEAMSNENEKNNNNDCEFIVNIQYKSKLEII
ncbi:MAG: hypothetical protein D6B28_09395 [Gammaproteobacteria bacterium]|nr:MAG: hypothetical protein D6B28_09395 [Gammaproteobacteria bacterium]